jgi:uncharacterized protein (TIGR00369 family)
VLLDDLSTLLKSSALHRWLGVELTHAESGKVEIRLPFRSEFADDEHSVNIHGGIISTLADIAACFAVISQTLQDAVSVDLHVDYLRMAVPGDLVATAHAIKVGRTLGHADVEIYGSDGRLVAIARSKMVTNLPDRPSLKKTEE